MKLREIDRGQEVNEARTMFLAIIVGMLLVTMASATGTEHPQQSQCHILAFGDSLTIGQTRSGGRLLRRSYPYTDILTTQLESMTGGKGACKVGLKSKPSHAILEIKRLAVHYACFSIFTR